MEIKSNDELNDYIASQTTRIVAKTVLNNIDKEIDKQAKEQKYSKNIAIVALIIFSVSLATILFYYGFLK